MNTEAMYYLLLVLVFFIGFILGAIVVLWNFAKDKSIARIGEDDVIVKKSELEHFKRRYVEHD
jgi:hypothetical protein